MHTPDGWTIRSENNDGRCARWWAFQLVANGQSELYVFSMQSNVSLLDILLSSQSTYRNDKFNIPWLNRGALYYPENCRRRRRRLRIILFVVIKAKTETTLECYCTAFHFKTTIIFSICILPLSSPFKTPSKLYAHYRRQPPPLQCKLCARPKQHTAKQQSNDVVSVKRRKTNRKHSRKSRKKKAKRKKENAEQKQQHRAKNKCRSQNSMKN